jgi:hypothetical protein
MSFLRFPFPFSFSFSFPAFARLRASRADVLQQALHDALARRRPQALGGLLSSHGCRRVAACLSREPGPVIADALSLLPPAQRRAVFVRLGRAARRRAECIGGRAFDAFQAAGASDAADAAGTAVPAGTWRRAWARVARSCRRPPGAGA